ncbi:MAG TPA: transporter [Pyrinomonadaceae bacterium]|nr:transporter [Pyrinomonadaceae bacterium]
MPHKTRLVFFLSIIVLLSASGLAQSDDEEDDFISPVRPTTSESATNQKAGVLQIEYGGDFTFDAPDFHYHHTAPLNVNFAVTDRLRLDFELDTFVVQKDRMGMHDSGVGDLNLGFKAIARAKPDEHLAVAFAYSIKLPTASEEKELGTGKVDHTIRLIFNRTYGKNDLVLNVSYLNVGREMSDKRDSGAQIAFAFERELPKNFGFILETFGNTVDEEQPRGIYLLGAVTYKVNKRLRFDAGVRPGFGHDAPTVGIVAGFTVGIGKGFK